MTYMLRAGKAVHDPDYTPPNMWNEKINEILSLMAVVFSGKEKVRPKAMQYIENNCARRAIEW